MKHDHDHLVLSPSLPICGDDGRGRALAAPDRRRHLQAPPRHSCEIRRHRGGRGVFTAPCHGSRPGEAAVPERGGVSVNLFVALLAPHAVRPPVEDPSEDLSPKTSRGNLGLCHSGLPKPDGPLAGLPAQHAGLAGFWRSTAAAWDAAAALLAGRGGAAGPDPARTPSARPSQQRERACLPLSLLSRTLHPSRRQKATQDISQIKKSNQMDSDPNNSITAPKGATPHLPNAVTCRPSSGTSRAR
ncbi:MAG: hypothetical protein QOE70_958 [Chthoniobacter sp.]|jgi:hypothetical protein|nr:hypothetical protein [Chthoniobacter sp.]